MKNNLLNRFAILLSIAALAVGFILTFAFTVRTTPNAINCTDAVTEESYFWNEETETLDVNVETFLLDEDIAAIRISDLGDLGQITKVNYVADEFLAPDSVMKNGQIVDLTKGDFSFAKRGTLQFVVLNIDSLSKDFQKDAEKLSAFKKGDYWRFTVGIPPIFSACNIYNRSQCVATYGEIEDYRFIDFTTSNDTVTTEHKSQTAYSYIELEFHTRQEAIIPDLSYAQTITIHYESDAENLAGIVDCPLIGTKNKVKDANADTSRWLYIAVAVCAITLAVFLFLCALKKSLSFVPQLLIALGVFFSLLSDMVLHGTTAAPAFWSGLGLAAIPFALAACLLTVGLNYKKLPLKTILTAVLGIGAGLTFLIPFVAYPAAAALGVADILFKCIGSVAAIAFIGIRAADKSDDLWRSATPLLTAITVAASLFLTKKQFIPADPLFWMYVIVIVTTFAVSLKVFVSMEKRNRYLTKNLQAEVCMQTTEFQTVISERDKLLRFLSHDLKKTLMSSSHFLDVLIAREQDSEQIKSLNIVKAKTDEVTGSLALVAKFSKFCYNAESAQIISLKELADTIYQRINPDCIADGVILKNGVESDYNVFAKLNGLENTITNIIVNALEHADCKEITLSAFKRKAYVVFAVHDNGKGISPQQDIFKPYVSENAGEENSGLGLYICKQIIESMNGELTYSSRPGSTTFYIALPKM